MKKKHIIFLSLFMVAASGDSGKFSVTWPEPKVLEFLDMPVSNSDMTEIKSLIQEYEKRSDGRSLAEIAVMFDYDLGSANQKSLEALALRKGDEMLSYLYLKRMTGNQCIAHNKGKKACLSEMQSAKKTTKTITAIEQGNDPTGSLYDPCEKEIMDFDIKMLKVAIAVYKNDNGRCPGSLSQLKEYMNKEYQHNIRIHSPGFQLYEYDAENESYSISYPEVCSN